VGKENKEKEEKEKKGRTIVIGDIHSSYLAVVELMKKVKPTTEDTFIFLGDYVDGWSDVVRTMNYLIEFKRKYNCIFLMGNHDCRWGLEGWLKTGTPGDSWLQNGGRITCVKLTDEFEDNPGFADELIEFLGDCHYHYIDSENRLFVHGGFHSPLGIQEDLRASVTNVVWDRTLIRKSIDKKEYNVKDDRLLLYKEIYIGHTSTVAWGVTTPMIIYNLYNMDTGAGWSGKLSAMDIDTKEVWQSKKVKTLYPEEKGR